MRGRGGVPWPWCEHMFADAYADQTECDHAALVMAIKEGRIKAEVDV